MILLADALAWLAPRTQGLQPEQVGLAKAAGRVLAADVPATAQAHPLAAIDGRAVRAAETEGASEYTPLPVEGEPILAGAPLPPGADAVLPLSASDGASALAPVAVGHGVAPLADAGLAAGTLIRPPHLALLARLGRDTASVVRRPLVELRVAGPKAGPDALTPMLAALVLAEGGLLGSLAPDLVLLAGRSGPGPDDDGVQAFGTLFAHGILMRPGETSALGTIAGGVALLLPGDPLACATAFALLAAPCLRRLGGRPEPAPLPATLTRKIPSGLGQIDAVRVRLEEGRATPLGQAEGGALGTGAGADGLVLVPEGSEGYPGGATVWVHPLP